MLDSRPWQPAAFDGHIGDGDVQVWLAMLDRLLPAAGGQPAMLSPDEMDRAGRFLFVRDRDRFVAARMVLRRLLAGYLGIDASDVRLSYDRYGKPSVSGSPSAPCFNVSHSQSAAVFAISRAGEIGVDIEALRPFPEAENIAARFFAAGEVAALRSLELPDRERAFFNCWTRKEAFIKAVGEGLSHPLDSFEVSLKPGEPVQLVHAGPSAAAVLHWTLAELPSVAGYVGAVAVRGHPRSIEYREWTE